MALDDIFTLLDRGRKNLLAGNYDKARREFLSVLDNPAERNAADKSAEYVQADVYMRHLGGNDNDARFKLLHAIDQEKDPQRLIKLLEEALDKNLTYALPLVNAPELAGLLAQLRHQAMAEEVGALWVDGVRALEDRDYARARDIFAQLAGSESATDVSQPAAVYLKHLEPDALRLLQEIEREKEDTQRCLKLLNQALDKQGLEFALPLFNQVRLADLREEAANEVRMWQDEKARESLDQGRHAWAAGQVADALTHFQHGLTFTEISAALREQLKGQRDACYTEQETQEHIEAALAQAENAYISGDYAAAREHLQAVAVRPPEDARVSKLSEQIQNAIDARTRLQDALAQANTEDNPWKAAKAYQEIQSEADTYKLATLFEQATTKLAAAQEKQEARAEQAQVHADQGAAAERGQDWEQALRAYEDALRLDKFNADALEGQSRVTERQAAFAEAERLKGQGRAAAASNNWAEAGKKFAEAKRLNPDDPELERLIAEAYDKDRANRTEKATIGAGITPYATPIEMSERFKEVKRAGIFTPEEHTAFIKAARYIFRREAAFKLRMHLEPASDHVREGDFAQVLSFYEQATTEWKSYLVEETRREGDIAALYHRLEILEVYQVHLKQAQQIWDNLAPKREAAATAQAAGQYRAASLAWRDVVRGLETAPAEAHYVLGRHDGDDDTVDYDGVWQHARAQFVDCTRRLSWQWEPVWREARWHAETLLQRGDVEAADGHIAEPHQNLVMFEDVADRYAAMTGAPWSLAEYGAKLAQLKADIDATLKANRSVSAAYTALQNGNLIKAEGEYRAALANTQMEKQAQIGLEAVQQLRDLEAQWQQHQHAGALAEEQQVLQHIVHRAPQWTQAQERLEEVQIALQRQAEIDGWRRSARLYQAQADVANARAFAQQVLDVGYDEEMTGIVAWANDYEAALKRRAEWLEQGRSALQQSDFRGALSFAEQVLAPDQDPTNVDARILREEASLAQTWLTEAREYFNARPPDYDEAENKLEAIRERLRMELQGECATLLGKVKTALKSNEQIQVQLNKVKKAVAHQQWLDVLHLSKRYGDQFITYFEQAERALREEIEESILIPNWVTVSRNLMALRKAGIEDDDIREWELSRDRYNALQEAERLLETGVLEEWETCDDALAQLAERMKLEFYVDPNPKLLSEYRRKLQMKILWEQGRQAMTPPADYQTAVSRLRESLRKRPEAADRKQIQALLEDAGINLVLEKVDAALRSGAETALQTTIQLLKRVNKDARITNQLQKVQQMQSLLNEADYEREHNVVRAAECLNEVLALYPNFRPAASRRQQLIAGQRKLGQEAEARNDLPGACKAYEILHAIAPEEDNPLDQLKGQLDREIGELNYKMTQALGDADLDIISAQALLNAVDRVPQDERHARTGFNNNYLLFTKRVNNIRTVDTYYEQAKSDLVSAHRVGEDEYYLVKQNLDKIATVEAIFSRRTPVRELQRALREHRERRKDIEGKTQDYTSALTSWQQPAAAVGADFIQPVQTFFDEGMQLLEQAITLNREIKKEDPDNVYELRPAFSGATPDPLDEIHTGLLKQQINFQSIAQLLLEGIRRRDGAEQKAKAAQHKQEDSKSLQDYKDALNLWEQAVENYRFSEESLQQAIQTETLSSRAVVLHDDAAQLIKKVTRSKEQVAKEIPGITGVITPLEERYKELKLEYDAENWGAALGCCAEILDINPNDADARRKRIELRRRGEQALMARLIRQKRWAGGIVAGILVVALAIAGWYFGSGPGKPESTLTPSPVVTEEVLTGEPTDAPTSESTMVSPTPAEATVPPTPAISLVFYDDPRVCTLVQSGVMAYREPSVDSIGQNLDMGLGQSLDGLAETSDGQWVMLELLSGEEVWVRASVVQCKE